MMKSEQPRELYKTVRKFCLIAAAIILAITAGLYLHNKPTKKNVESEKKVVVEQPEKRRVVRWSDCVLLPRTANVDEEEIEITAPVGHLSQCYKRRHDYWLRKEPLGGRIRTLWINGDISEGGPDDLIYRRQDNSPGERLRYAAFRVMSLEAKPIRVMLRFTRATYGQ